MAQSGLGTGRIACCLSLADIFGRLETALVDRYTIEHELGAGARSIATSVSVTVSVTHGKVWHSDFSSPAADDMNSRFAGKLPAFHARLDPALNQ